MDRSLGGGVILELVLERSDYGGGREQTAVLREGGVPDQNSIVPEGGNPVTHSFGRVFGRSRSNGGAKPCEGAASGLRDSRQILFHIPRSGLAFRRRNGLGRFSFSHAAMLQGPSFQVHAAGRLRARGRI